METITISVLENAKQRLGRNVRARREQIGFTQESLAELVGVSSTTIGLLERGVVWPEYDNIQAIAKALEVSELNLFAGDVNLIPPTPEQALSVLAKLVASVSGVTHSKKTKGGR